jgi:signal transduction histidine kinase/DNA-binding response OmpR family regulator
MKARSTFGQAAFLVPALLASVSVAPAQQPGPKRVVVMNWYDRNYPSTGTFDRAFQAALESRAPGEAEFYTEYMETNRFPGEGQSQLLSDYLQKKYAGFKIDVVVSTVGATLDFLLEHRRQLFSDAPIVFATERPVPPAALLEARATGFYFGNTYARNLELALNLHPGTRRVFVVSGTVNRDKSLESTIRDDLRRLKSKAAITYLTDLTLEELSVRVKNLPTKSVILYAWQQSLNPQGKVVESQAILRRISDEANVPVYGGMSAPNVGLGTVGAYVWTSEGKAAKLAELSLRVASGTRPQDIPTENGPTVPMFDWRELRRWGIHEDLLPPDSVILFREPTMWQQYRWRIVAAIVVFILQGILIGSLLVERRRARRSRKELKEYERGLEELVRRRTAELVEARDQAMAANRSKSAFLANISHDLRTPLNAILGFSGMVLRDATLSEQHRKDLTIVGSSGEHLLELIDDVLDMAKIESGRVTVAITSFDLPGLVNETVNLLREHAAAKNLELSLEVSSRAPRFVRSDPGKFRQILTNLVGNAVKYTEEGKVTVKLDARAGDSSSGFVLILDVEDTGIGISVEDQARIFGVFVQARTSTGRGVGLGLSISRELVQLLRGTIQVKSAPGRGARFRVEVPMQVAEAPEVTEKADAGSVAVLEPGQPDYRVLIVEDQRENWFLLQRLLQAAGFEVRVAEDGGEAVEQFKAWRPQFIWMDLRLPVLSGMEAAEKIRTLEGGQEVKIVAITASAFESQRQEVLAAGFDDFLRKPYRHHEVFDYMARHLGIPFAGRKPPQTAAVKITLRPADLAALPAALRDELENAVISLDRERVARLVEKISEHDAALGNVLARLADRFAYTQIFDAVRGCKMRMAQAK